MKISYNWLKEFVKFSNPPESVAEVLTSLGVETVIASGSSRGWTNVITAKVTKVEKHPNSAKLSICQLTDGKNNYSVVCGAPNVAQDQTVPLAVLGATLPNDMSIRKVTIRGIDSEGMICSQKELGLSEESNGIMVLSTNTPLGVPFESTLGEMDTLFDIEITTNRADALSHWGTARELAARLRLPVNLPEIKKPLFKDKLDITVTARDLCPRYIGCLITDIKVGPSPDWMSEKLRKCGIRPINNIVDITNYVLLELGHPLHAFDTDKLAGKKLIVRRSARDEKITALDGKEYKLTDSMLAIADGEKPQAIAGIMGGEFSGVTQGTNTIILESALFDPVNVRRTSKALNLSSEASYRFERGTSWEACELASWRTINLIEQLAGGKLQSRVDIKEKDYNYRTIDLRPERVKHLLDIDLPVDEMKAILSSLGLKVSSPGGRISCQIPSWRNDLEQEADLIEEIARVNGYDKIPVTIQPVNPETTGDTLKTTAEGLLRGRLIDLGFSEVLNYSFTSNENIARYGLKPALTISNPISHENEALRPCLLPCMMNNLLLNIAQGFGDIKFFESGKIFSETGEKKSFAVLAYGPAWPQWWGWDKMKIQRPAFDFYFISGLIERMFAGNKIVFKTGENVPCYYHPGKTASVLINGKMAGWAGILLPNHSPKAEIETAYAEFDLELIDKCWNRSVPKYSQIRKFPCVKRDISLLSPKEVTYENIKTVLTTLVCTGTVNDSLLEEFDLISEYEDDAKLGKDNKSYALHLSFRHNDHTLTDAEANTQVENILLKLKNSLNITLRSV